MTARLLLVEDDRRVADALVPTLERLGYVVTHVETGEAALRSEPVDLVLLDLRLPDVDGIDVCRQMRADSDVAIIVLTSRARAEERVAGLRAGADDYVVKPFSFAELVARMEAVLWRSGGATSEQAHLSAGPVEIDTVAHTVTVAGREVALTRKEHDLLTMFVRHAGEVLSRPAILQQVWHTAWEGKSRTVDVHVASLRHKLHDPGLIATVHGVGYQFVPSADASRP